MEGAGFFVLRGNSDRGTGAEREKAPRRGRRRGPAGGIVRDAGDVPNPQKHEKGRGTLTGYRRAPGPKDGSKRLEPRRTPALVESLGYAHNVLLVSGAGVAHEVVGPDPRCCPSQALRAERHDNEPPRRQRRRVDNADAFKHLHGGLGIIEVSLREPIRPLRRREHGDALLAVFILDIVEAPAPRLPICLAPHADDVEMFFGLHAPPPQSRGPGHPKGYPGPVQWLRPPGNPAQAPGVVHAQSRPYLAGRADRHRPWVVASPRQVL